MSSPEMASIRATWRRANSIRPSRSATRALLLMGAILFSYKINSSSSLEQQPTVASGGSNSSYYATTSAANGPGRPYYLPAQVSSVNAPNRIIKKCTRQSIILARQMLVHELNQMNNLMPMWFNDLDKDEIIESQRHSLSNIVMSGFGTQLLHSDGQPLVEIESSYFRSARPGSFNHNLHHYNNNYIDGTPNRYQNAQAPPTPALSIKLIRRHQDRCYLNTDKSQYTYVIGLSIGPIEHHLDVLYNLPNGLGLGQPTDWRFGQITLHVPKMIYEITLKQLANYKLSSLSPFTSNCPLDIVDVLYLPPNLYTTSASMQTGGQQQQLERNLIGANTNKPPMSITSWGLPLNNRTILQVERLFDDYTRPTISRRLRQMLKFNLNTKTLPLACA